MSRQRFSLADMRHLRFARGGRLGVGRLLALSMFLRRVRRPFCLWPSQVRREFTVCGKRLLLVIPTSNREEESVFSLAFCNLRSVRNDRNGNQEHFFRKPFNRRGSERRSYVEAVN